MLGNEKTNLGIINKKFLKFWFSTKSKDKGHIVILGTKKVQTYSKLSLSITI